MRLIKIKGVQSQFKYILDKTKGTGEYGRGNGRNKTMGWLGVRGEELYDILNKILKYILLKFSLYSL